MTNFNSFLIFSLISILSGYGLIRLFKKWNNFLISFFGKVLKILSSAILFLSLLICLYGAYNNFFDYWNNDRLKVHKEAVGVKLYITEDDLIFSKGKPIEKRMNGAERLFMFNDGLIVGLDGGKVSRIDIICSKLTSSYLYTFGGVSCGSSIEVILDRFGAPDNISTSEDKASRIYNYPQYNIAFELSMSRVVQMTIFDAMVATKGYIFNPPAPPKQTKAEKPANRPDLNLSAEEINAADHCAPNLSRQERLKRLALTGTVRETSYQTYSNGKHFVEFLGSGSDILLCR